jgi:hypothetical protein
LVLQKGCNRKAQMMDNACAGFPKGRIQDEFQQKCDDLHKLLGTMT